MQASKRGFTLIEVLIISPIVILMIATFIGLAVMSTGEALRNGERNAMTFAIQSSLDIIEDDIYRAQSFPSATSGFIVSSTRNTLIIRSAATTTNPQSSSRNLVYIVPTANASPCPTNLEPYSYQTIYYIYYIRSGGLWKRTVVNPLPSDYTTCPSSAWQKTTCHESDSNCTSATSPKDIQLLNNVSSVNFAFYGSPKSTTPRSCSYWSESNTPSTIGVTLTTSSNVAGETITESESIRASSINIKNYTESCTIDP